MTTAWTRRKVLQTSAAVAVGAVSGTAMPRFSYASNKVEEIKKAGVLRIAIEASYPPFTHREGEKIVGYDIDLGNELAKELGVRAEFVDTAYQGIFVALLAGRFDVI